MGPSARIVTYPTRRVTAEQLVKSASSVEVSATMLERLLVVTPPPYGQPDRKKIVIRSNVRLLGKMSDF